MHDERLIIERAKKDPEAFGVLVELHYASIFGYIHRRVRDWTDTQDLTSEVFFKAFKGFWRYRWQGIPFSAWLFRIATNEIRMYFRRGRRPNVSLNQLMEEHGFEPADPHTLNAEKLEAETRLQEYQDFFTLQSRIAALFSALEEKMAAIDRSPYRFLSIFLLVGCPLAALALNLLAITHVQIDRLRRELQVTVKLKLINLVLSAICLFILGMIFAHVVAENVRVSPH